MEILIILLKLIYELEDLGAECLRAERRQAEYLQTERQRAKYLPQPEDLLTECPQAEGPERSTKPCPRPNHKPYNASGGSTGYFPRVKEFNDRIYERMGQDIRVQSLERPENPGGLSDVDRES